MLCIITIALGILVLEVSSHGMMLYPPNRSSLWRFNRSAPINYNDNQNFCGGIDVLWITHRPRCGVCGDSFFDDHPQPNENTGIYGQGVIVAEYKAGSVIEISVLLTANHLGHFEYHLCELNNSTTYEPGEECFKILQFEDGNYAYPINNNHYQVVNYVKLPRGFTCEHCVLRWHYRAGNNWGFCDDGSQGIGCGRQEYFRSCSDIKIVGS